MSKMKRFGVVLAAIAAILLLLVGGLRIAQYAGWVPSIMIVSDGDRMHYGGMTLVVPNGWSGEYFRPQELDYLNSLNLERKDGSSITAGVINAKTLKNYQLGAKATTQKYNGKDITSRYIAIKEVVSVTQNELASNWINTHILCTSKSGGIVISIRSPKKGPLPDTEIADDVLSMFPTSK